MKKLKELLDRCRQSMHEIDAFARKYCEVDDLSTLVEIIEFSDQPLLFEVKDDKGNIEEYVRTVAVGFLEEWIGGELEQDVCDMAYGDYLIQVDHWLAAQGHETTSEEEMETADEMQCDGFLPHVCGRTIEELRHDDHDG